jgi:hypothetical protein
VRARSLHRRRSRRSRSIFISFVVVGESTGPESSVGLLSESLISLTGEFMVPDYCIVDFEHGGWRLANGNRIVNTLDRITS